MTRSERFLCKAGFVGLIATLTPWPALAQQPGQPAQWDQLPRMQLERQFAGPLRDTIVQRWRDPTDGSICYIYLPITAPHTPATGSGYVQYGPNAIGSISCMPEASAAKPASTPAVPTPRQPPPRATPPSPRQINPLPGPPAAGQ